MLDFFWRSLDGGGYPPMRRHGLPRPQRTDLVRCVIADCEDVKFCAETAPAHLPAPAQRSRSPATPWLARSIAIMAPAHTPTLQSPLTCKRHDSIALSPHTTQHSKAWLASRLPP